MDKIKALMEQMGFSAELSAELIKSINEHVDTEKRQLNSKLKESLKKAKEFCLQAIKEEKARLAKGVEVYLESKVDRIERSRSKQMVSEDTQATNQLKKIKSLLEGVEISKVEAKNSDLQTKERTISLLEHKVERLSKDKKDLSDKLRVSNEIAARATRRAMVSESKTKPVVESKEPKVEKTLNEVKQEVVSSKPTVAEKKTLTPENIADLM